MKYDTIKHTSLSNYNQHFYVNNGLHDYLYVKGVI